MLAQVIAEVRNRIQTANLVSLFLDFDGTLVPITTSPAESRLSPGVVESLQLIADQEFWVTTIISGRAVDDLYRRIRMKGLIYVGNHGLEIFGRDLSFVEPIAWSRRAQLESLCDGLVVQLRSLDGVFVEHKGLSASIHYRLAEKTDIPRVEAAVHAMVAREGAPFRVNTGRKVLEIVPRSDWDKGAAVRWINSHLSQRPDLSIYLGDDATDEDAFKILPDAVTVKVGEGTVKTGARYRLPNPAAVHVFLDWLSRQEPRGSGERKSCHRPAL